MLGYWQEFLSNADEEKEIKEIRHHQSMGRPLGKNGFVVGLEKARVARAGIRNQVPKAGGKNHSVWCPPEVPKVLTGDVPILAVLTRVAECKADPNRYHRSKCKRRPLHFAFTLPPRPAHFFLFLTFSLMIFKMLKPAPIRLLSLA